MKDLIPIAGWVIPDWANFVIMAGAFLLVAASAMIWIAYFHKNKRRRRKYRHHHHSRQPVSIAQKGGLPPARSEERPPGLSSPTSRS
jgi:hypothetical protein